MNTRKIGNLGEDLACDHLIRSGYKIIDRNYQRKWGEIDIIATKDGITHFFEVKSVRVDFSRVTNAHTPEENVHRHKLKHIGRMIETYLSDRDGGVIGEFQFHVLTVRMNQVTRTAQVRWIKNIII